MLPKRVGVFINVTAERVNPRAAVERRRAAMCGCDDLAERVGKSRINLFGEMVERAIFVEARHFHRPLDRLARAADRELAAPFAGDRHNAAIDLRRVGRVDLELGLARGLALLEGGVIEKRKTHGALDLQRPIRGEENR